jgi:hypothetical protein
MARGSRGKRSARRIKHRRTRSRRRRGGENAEEFSMLPNNVEADEADAAAADAASIQPPMNNNLTRNEDIQYDDGNHGMYDGGRRRRRGSKRSSKRSSRRGRRGGAGAADWVAANFGGSTSQQFMNTFGNGGTAMAGNLIPTLTGAPAVGPNNIPQGSLAMYAGPAQSGGRGSRRHGKKGGYWAQVIQQALVPFGLFGLQNAFSRKHHKKHHKGHHK